MYCHEAILCASLPWHLQDFQTRSRAGGLTDDIRNNNIVLAASGTFGLPPKKLGGSISRSQVMPHLYLEEILHARLFGMETKS